MVTSMRKLHMCFKPIQIDLLDTDTRGCFDLWEKGKWKMSWFQSCEGWKIKCVCVCVCDSSDAKVIDNSPLQAELSVNLLSSVLCNARLPWLPQLFIQGNMGGGFPPLLYEMLLPSYPGQLRVECWPACGSGWKFWEEEAEARSKHLASFSNKNFYSPLWCRNVAELITTTNSFSSLLEQLISIQCMPEVTF